MKGNQKPCNVQDSFKNTPPPAMGVCFVPNHAENANILDDILNALPKAEKGHSDGGFGGKKNPLEAEWKWKSKPLPRAPKSGPEIFDVTKYGAKNDGSSESTKAFLDTWKDACSYSGDSWFVVPDGEFLLGEVEFEGPCTKGIQVEIRGTVKAVKDPSKYTEKSWIMFRHVDGLNISGGGTLDGQGELAWEKNSECKVCNMLAVSLKLIGVTNALVRQIYLVNSKAFNMHVTDCKRIHIYDVKITCPEESPNTDGIHISTSTGIKVTDSFIGVGDDCVSIGDGTKSILVTRVICGPGHGISIGSLGKVETEEPVSNIHVNNCTLVGTTNGVRIKTWRGSSELKVSDLTFENIIMNRVSFPIIIDQHYCPSKDCADKPPSKVKLSNIVYKNIRGTSFTKLAVNVMCSEDYPCEDVHMSDIDLAYQNPEMTTASMCSNIKVITTGKQNPPLCTHLLS
ncbi:Glycoside hydrolase [Cinnamomum micranthum f. kanehirae]|uniref:Glycoside hydrolase n=1 Tax=Cinnamomum micranthum f. kanehirae TaxID=337451 RepID=A0A3S3R258_9MAGN|nr:Glycoside hydrolase [Cinnamomum micranthum f. kanehirae]